MSTNKGLVKRWSSTSRTLSKEERIERANKIFGSEVVEFTLSVVYLAGSGEAWKLFEERGMYKHSECVKNIYFE